MDDLLSQLVQHCPDRPPQSRQLYGRQKRNLKAALDSRKWVWIPGRRKGVRVKSPGSFIKKLPWFRRWISAANGGVKTQYSAQMHSLHHTRFKEKTSLLFARLAKRVRARSSSMFVLDDFAPSSSSVLRTQQHLLRAGVKGSRICIANPGSLQCAASHKSGAVTICGKLEDALQGELKDKRSCAAYLDTCSGSAEYIADLIRAGFGTIEVRRRMPYRVLDAQTYDIDEDILLESIEVVAIKDPMPPDGACVFTGRVAFWLGEGQFDDGKGHVLIGEVPLAVCDKTAAALAALNHPRLRVTGSTWHYAGGGCC